MKHPHHALDAVLDFEPEATGQPSVVGQPPPPLQESLRGAPAAGHDPVPADGSLPHVSAAPDLS